MPPARPRCRSTREPGQRRHGVGQQHQLQRDGILNRFTPGAFFNGRAYRIGRFKW
jgi:hypothetical protein